MSGGSMFYVRSAIRALRRTPVLSLAAVLSLAIGIGAKAAIFSVFNQALLKELPVQQPEQLVTFSAPGEKQGRTSSRLPWCPPIALRVSTPRVRSAGNRMSCAFP